VVTGGAELARGFFSVFSRNMRDLGTPVHSERFFDAIARALPQHARITLVILSGDAVAAGLSFRHAHGTEVAWASSVRSFNRFAVNMLLYWELLRQAMASGSACFDFGRSTIDSGPFRFKKQWGARAEPLHYAYWTRSGGRPDLLSPASPKYRLAVHAWRHLPLSLTRAIGPRIVKYLP
jgi:FemAB-related protein (PEP-CTERM system-associated)